MRVVITIKADYDEASYDEVDDLLDMLKIRFEDFIYNDGLTPSGEVVDAVKVEVKAKP